MPKRLAIIDYGLGNLHSVTRAMQQAAPGWQVELCTSARQLASADKLVFPGVGAIGDCLDGLQRLGLTQPLLDYIDHRPCLAICVGFQALFDQVSEFGDRPGLGFVHSRVERLDLLANQAGVNLQSAELRVPHSGWNQLRLSSQHAHHPLFDGVGETPYVYFVHSYAVAARQQTYCAATTHHGLDLLALLIHKQVIGCQFHPEKSHAPGQRLLRNFIRL